MKSLLAMCGRGEQWAAETADSTSGSGAIGHRAGGEFLKLPAVWPFVTK
jgi:hypothetical protein